MLTAKILNSQASLNNFKEIGDVDFKLGDAVKLVFRLFDPELEDRFIPPSTAIVSLTFNNLDTTTFIKTATIVDADDRSIMTVSLSTTDTAQLLGGNVSFIVDLLGDQTQILYGLMYNPLHKVAVQWGANG